LLTCKEVVVVLERKFELVNNSSSARNPKQPYRWGYMKDQGDWGGCVTNLPL
jgi:hypothetical protein